MQERLNRYEVLLRRAGWWATGWTGALPLSESHVLEPGAGDGVISCWLSDLGATVTATDARREIWAADGVPGVTFIQQEATAHLFGCIERNETYDLILCSGLLYHLEEPWELLALCARVSDCLLLDTEEAITGAVERESPFAILRGEAHHENPSNPRAGLTNSAFWLTQESLQDVLRWAGYTYAVRSVLPPDTIHPARKHLNRTRPIYYAEIER